MIKRKRKTQCTMWKLQEATNLLIRFILILVFTAQLLDTTQALSDKRLCADEHCKETISYGIGTIRYVAAEEGRVSFQPDSSIVIKSKSAGKDPTLWGIEVDGIEGYAPKKYIRETRIIIPTNELKYTVDVNPPNAAPILKSSEKPVEQENYVETTTTKPLSAVPMEATERPVINNNLNENLTMETPTTATPVLSEIVDGTPIPISINDSDGVVETVNEEIKPLNRYEELNESKELKSKEQEKVFKVTEGISENKNDDKNITERTEEVTSESSQLKTENVTIKEREKEHENLETETSLTTTEPEVNAVASEVNKTDTNETSTRDNTKPSKETDYEINTNDNLKDQVLSHITEENTKTGESLKGNQEKSVNVSDNKDSDNETLKNSQNTEENSEKHEQANAENFELVFNKAGKDIPSTPLTTNEPEVNAVASEVNKTDTNETSTRDNTKPSKETDYEINTNDNLKDQVLSHITEENTKTGESLKGNQEKSVNVSDNKDSDNETLKNSQNTEENSEKHEQANAENFELVFNKAGKDIPSTPLTTNEPEVNAVASEVNKTDTNETSTRDNTKPSKETDYEINTNDNLKDQVLSHITEENTKTGESLKGNQEKSVNVSDNKDSDNETLKNSQNTEENSEKHEQANAENFELVFNKAGKDIPSTPLTTNEPEVNAVASEVNKTDTNETSTRDNTKPSKETDYEINTNDNLKDQVLSHITEENTKTGESLKGNQEKSVNVSDNKDSDNETLKNSQNTEENSEKHEQANAENFELVFNKAGKDIPSTPLTTNEPEVNAAASEVHKTDTNETSTRDNTKPSKETDYEINTNDNLKDNDQAVNNSINTNNKESDYNYVEPQTETELTPQEDINSNENSIHPHEHQTKTSFNINPTETTMNDHQLPVKTTTGLPSASKDLSQLTQQQKAEPESEIREQKLPLDIGTQTPQDLSHITEENTKTGESLKGNQEKSVNVSDNKDNETLKTSQNTEDTVKSSENPKNVETSTEYQQYYEDLKMTEQVPNQQENIVEQINPTTNSPYNEISVTTAQPHNNIPVNSAHHNYEIPVNTKQPHSHYDYNYQEISTTEIPPKDYYAQQHGEVITESSRPYYETYEEQTTVAYNNIPTIPPETTPQPLEKRDEYQQQQKPKALPSSTPGSHEENKEKKGLFATIMGTVNNVLSINKKHKRHEFVEDNELERILFSNGDNGHKVDALSEEESLQYCKKLSPNGDCPQSEYGIHHHQHNHHHHETHSESSEKSLFNSDLTLDSFLKALASKILELSELLAFLVIAAAASLFFIFGYYCFCNSSREGALLSKLNQLESSLLATHKENSILKHNLMSTRQKLASIEDNSFGSNDMVVALKKELEEELMEKARLKEQITVLQKELENAADAGIELNKIVAELLSNQTGDESIISSVEELQKQLNEQQNTILEINASLAEKSRENNTILEINASLAEKSRENSELQLLIAEQNARYEAQIANIQRDNDELEHEKGSLMTKLEELKNDFDKDITGALEGKNFEIKRLQNEIIELNNKVENEHTKWQTSVAKIEALEECLKNVRKDPNVNITEVIDVANVKAQLIETQKKYTTLKERLEIELDQRKISENQLQILSAEVEKLKQDFNQSEKDKLEAQTRLEVLSNYFKDKENQLQKELSLKEAMWLKQQGETTTTVDRVTTMQEEIQSLKSQNDSLRAEIEAQVAAHKAQTGTLENRAHETWLAARQADRRYEEARAEATALRRKLTALAGGNVSEVNKTSAVTAGLGEELPQAPSPIHMESPGSPLLGRMPPPFLPPPFMGPPPPFMGMPPPPPFVPPGEMRPAPLGRIMSPPPQRSGRFSPQHLDYEDYLDYEGNNTWHRHTYSPPPRTYRSLSPTDSRYNYGTERDLMSTYDTETDFSPPPSPRDSRRRVINSSERIDNNKSPYGNNKKFGNKGLLSSGSEKSYNSPSHHDTKSKKGNGSSGGGGGKNLV